MNKIIDNEITNSIGQIMKKRLTTPVYGIFLISWIVFHWKFIFTMFFVSEEKIWGVTGLLKNDYLYKTFFDFSDFSLYLNWILPFIITYFIIWHFPKWIAIPAFKKEEEYKTEKRKIEIIERKKLEEEIIKKLKVVTERTQKEKEIKEKEKEIEKVDPTISWQKEYSQFVLNNTNILAMVTANNVVYNTEGRFVTNGRNISQGFNTFIASNYLSRLDALGLIKINSESSTMVFTEKGKFFIKKLHEQNKLL